MGDLLKNLQRIGDCELDDITVAHEALAEIVDLRLRIAELEARELGWLTTLSTMELEKRELEAENQRLRDALEIIAGKRQCVNNLMGNVEIAMAALLEGGENG